MDSELKKLAYIFDNVIKYRNERISLISSENISSKLLLASYCLGLSDQYCSRLPKDKNVIDNLTFSNISALDEINYNTRQNVLKIFNASECDIRPLSGLNAMTILMASLLSKNDTLFKVDDLDGGHLSTAPLADRLGINYFNMKLGENYRIDLDYFYNLYKHNKPKMIFLDSSYVLFPYPVNEIRDIVGSDTIITYDASHLISLIAASLFQDPFNEGADLIHSTTHKIFWGPQKSMVLFKENSNLVNKFQNAAKDWISNTHIHHILALYIATIEYMHFGKEYAENIVKNSKIFAECLQNSGLNVAAHDYGFTQSGQLWIEFKDKEEAIEQFKKLEQINISANVIFLPGNKWGWRLAVNELTRYDAKKDDFEFLARIISDLVYDRKPIMQLRKEAFEFKNNLGKIKYSFDNTDIGKKMINRILDSTFGTKNDYVNKTA